MKGARSSIAMNTTMIFGTKVSVTSWIWVRAWNSEMMRPINSAMIMSGAPSFRVTMTASRPTSRRADSSMCQLPSDRHPQDFLVGGDHTIPDRGHGLHRQLRRGHRIHHLVEIGLAFGSLDRHLLGIAGRVHRILGELLQHLGEA